jgi:hypothetical protein
MADAARKDDAAVSSIEDYCIEMLAFMQSARSEVASLLAEFDARVDSAEAMLRQRLIGLRLSQDRDLSGIIKQVDTKFDEGKLRPVVLTTSN